MKFENSYELVKEKLTKKLWDQLTKETELASSVIPSNLTDQQIVWAGVVQIGSCSVSSHWLTVIVKLKLKVCS